MRNFINIVENAQEDVLPNHLSALIKNGHVEVWRAIRAGLGFIDDLLPGSGLGKYWTYDISGAIPFDGSRNGHIYRLHGMMPISSIDWRMTQELDGSGEFEIRAYSGKPVTLLGVDEINLAGHTLEADLKPSIAGQVMSTGPWV